MQHPLLKPISDVNFLNIKISKSGGARTIMMAKCVLHSLSLAYAQKVKYTLDLTHITCQTATTNKHQHNETLPDSHTSVVDKTENTIA